MRFLLAAVNAKYIHSNLAVRSIRTYAEKNMLQHIEDGKVHIENVEYTINQPVEKIIADIYERDPDVLMLSCYIWNIEYIWDIIGDMGKIRPYTDIWLGGPEVSFGCENVIEGMRNVKGIIAGEGEDTCLELIKAYAESVSAGGYAHADDEKLECIKGIVFRGQHGLIKTEERRGHVDMSRIPFPYDMGNDADNKVIYYESSRGCPFRCSYCLSSVDRQLRFRDIKLVEKELDHFLECRVRQVKFIDRTFNCDRRRTEAIWKYIKENDNGVTNFHFEIAGELLTDEETEILNSMRPGQIQLEIGVQSTNPDTLRKINRMADIEKLKRAAAAVKKGRNVHIHLDLIAGLPFENYESFRRSFDDVYSMRPDQLQLGFLKILKGSPIEKKCGEYGIRYTDRPPYEVLQTKWLSYEEIIKLKFVEEMVETYHNSRQFSNMLIILLDHFESPFVFFEKLSEWYRSSGRKMINISRNERYEMLMDFGRGILDENEMMRFVEAAVCDYYMRENAKNRPSFLGDETVDRQLVKRFYSIESREHRYLKGGRYDTEDPRLLRNLTHLERLGGRYLLFDYEDRNPLDNNARIKDLDQML